MASLKQTFQTFQDFKGYFSLHLPLPPHKTCIIRHRSADWLWILTVRIKVKQGRSLHLSDHIWKWPKSKGKRSDFTWLQHVKIEKDCKRKKENLNNSFKVADWEQIPAANLAFGPKPKTGRLETASDEFQMYPAAWQRAWNSAIFSNKNKVPCNRWLCPHSLLISTSRSQSGITWRDRNTWDSLNPVDKILPLCIQYIQVNAF